MGGLSDFLGQTKTDFLRDLQSKNIERWTVVMGNEAGDLDTIACSVAYSYLSSKYHNQPTIALIQTPRTDLYLRPENLYAFSLANLTSKQQELLCIDDIPSSAPPLSQIITKFALVDHNRLLDQFRGGPGKVVGIIDHHADEKQHLDAEIREIVNPVGGCASLVARHFKSVWDASVPPELATFLLSAIYIDTGGLKPDDKAVEIDEQSAAFLTPNSTFNPDNQSLTGDVPPPPPIGNLADELSDRKKDVSHFTTRDLLRRDYKEFVFGGLRTGLSTVPVGLEDCLKRDGAAGFWKALDGYMDDKGLAVLGFLATFKTQGKPKHKHKREILLLLKESAVSADIEKRLFEGMEADPQLQLEPKLETEVADGRHAKVWNQKNTDVSRKYTAPLIRRLIEGGDAPAGEQQPEADE